MYVPAQPGAGRALSKPCRRGCPGDRRRPRLAAGPRVPWPAIAGVSRGQRRQTAIGPAIYSEGIDEVEALRSGRWGIKFA